MRGLTALIQECYDDLKHSVDFLTVYIMEAHAADEWPINSERYNGPCNTIVQHKTLEDRVKVGQLFVDKFSWRLPLVCDTIQNDFDAAFSPWPLRFYVIERLNGRTAVTYIAQPKDCSYDICHLIAFLRERLGIVV